MRININSELSLELINESHAQPIFELVHKNRTYLRDWLTFVDKMQSIEFAEKFVKGTMQRNLEDLEYAFVIIYHSKIIGRIGIYKIDHQNKIAEIGYWIEEKMQGNGFVILSCKTLLDFCFKKLHLNRLEIKCGVENIKSETIPVKLNFKKEGIIRQGELLNDKFIDLYLYSLLKEEYESNANNYLSDKSNIT